MSIYLGNTEIGQIYLGSTEISEAYLGSTKVFGGGTPPTPTTPIPIEYLTNTGSQYIDAGITLASDTTKITLVFDVKFSATAISGNSLMVARSFPNSGVQVYTNFSDNKNLVVNQGASREPTLDTRYLVTTETTATKRKIKLDSGTFANQTFSRSITDDNPLYILGDPDFAVDSRCARGTYYSFKIYKNDVLVRDYIPVRIGQVGYFLDNVSGELFGNLGSGNFILGNDINT